VAYATDLDVALTIINDIVTANARVLKEPAPMIQTILLGSSGVTVAAKPWVAVADYLDAMGEINKVIVEGFRGRGIVLPFPQNEVRLIGQKL
jgi:small conductance mechanosensitive channel